jgi:uncharacterized protein YceK
MNRLATLLLLLVAVALGGCASEGKTVLSARDKVLRSYASAIRWGEFETAWGFVEPAAREAHPLTELEIERFKQIQVTGYEVRNLNEEADGSVSQVVEIRLVSRNTQVERAIVDHQRWIFDPAAKRWWLASGLPDITQRQ